MKKTKLCILSSILFICASVAFGESKELKLPESVKNFKKKFKPSQRRGENCSYSYNSSTGQTLESCTGPHSGPFPNDSSAAQYLPKSSAQKLPFGSNNQRPFGSPN